MKYEFVDDAYLKVDNDKNVVLFLLNSDNDMFLQFKGLVAEIVQKLYQGTELEEIKAEILNEYEVSETQLNQDLETLRSKLVEKKFLK